ncbi:MAG: MgtC/SapB family protein [Burkholderiaceae bacterium]
MNDRLISLPRIEWPYVEALIRLSLALALGLLIGLERERSQKEAGTRTFASVALLGALGGLMGESFALASMLFVALLTVYLNARTLMAREGAELTTSAAMMITCAAGVLCGNGHRLTPAALIVSLTALLSWKRPLAGFSRGLTDAEVRSAIILAILAIVIYPALPDKPLGPMGLIEPRAAWITVLVIAGIGSVNYVLLKLYGTRGADVAGFLGGLVNSSITVNELAGRVATGGDAAVPTAYRGILLATAAMITRNIVLLAILAPVSLAYSLSSFAAMLLACVLMLRFHPPPSAGAAPMPMNLELPFSLKLALKYGVLFLLLSVGGTLMLKLIGEAAFYAVSFVGGLFSSASAVASAADLVSRQQIDPQQGAIGTLLASWASVVVNLPFLMRAHHRGLSRQIGIAVVVVMAAGAIGLLLSPAATSLLELFEP